MEGEEFEVEKILDCGQHQGKKLYLVKWVGYGHEDNTWEPKKNLQAVSDLIQKFEEKYPEICRKPKMIYTQEEVEQRIEREKKLVYENESASSEAKKSEKSNNSGAKSSSSRSSTSSQKRKLIEKKI